MIKMNEKIKDVLINLATGITGLIPKKKNLWLFGAWQARLYADKHDAGILQSIQYYKK